MAQPILFPNSLNPMPDRELMWERFTKLKLTGSINIPPKVSQDLRYRLVQLHEYLHAYLHDFREEVAKLLMEYMHYAVNSGRIKAEGKAVAPLFIPSKNEQLIPKDFQILKTRNDGWIGYAEFPLSWIYAAIVAAQYEELLCDFFAGAAGGAAYWATMADFTLDCTSLDDLMYVSWDVELLNIYDAHPAPLLRTFLLPQFFHQYFKKTIMGPDAASIRKEVDAYWEDLDKFVMSKWPRPEYPKAIIYRNSAAPPAIREVHLPLEPILSFYCMVFESFCVLMRDWWNNSHALFPLIQFFNIDHHRRIRSTAKEFVKTMPPYKDYMDSIVGAAAARLCFDRKEAVPLQDLQNRARKYQQRAKKQLVFIQAT